MDEKMLSLSLLTTTQSSKSQEMASRRLRVKQITKGSKTFKCERIIM